MAFQPAEDVIYAMGADEVLSTLDPVTGAQTIIGGTGGVLVGPLAFEGLNGTGRLLGGNQNGLDSLYELNRTTGVATSIGSVKLTGDGIVGYRGLALDPTTGTLWGVVGLTSQGGSPNVRGLITIDVGSLTATLVATLSETRPEGITFLPNGELLAVTDDLSLNPEQLWSVNKTTGVMTFIVALGNGTDGEHIVRIPARLAGTLTVPAVGGVASFGDLQIDGPAAGYVLRATATGLSEALSGAFDILVP